MESFKQNAVVFDCAGTLVEMYRVTKDLETGKILLDADNLKLVSESESRGLIIMDAPLDLVQQQPPERLLSDFLRKEKIPFGVAYASAGFNGGDISRILLDDQTTMAEFLETNKEATALFDDIIYEVFGFIADSKKDKITHIMSTGGKLFENAKDVIEAAKENCDIFIASGDDYANLHRVADKLGIAKENVIGLCNDTKKQEIVFDLQSHYPKVIMIGDGLNDMLALQAADFGILISRHNYHTPDDLKDAADEIVDDLGECTSILQSYILE
ncbi:MAG: HAD family hydrolase [Methanosarcinales archaeon]|jgi:Cu+-exporting ATPase|nr:HAD family hydrolase [Methanosarcinales archaeon]